MTRTRAKARALTAVPQSREDAVRAVRRVGELRDRIAARKAKADDAVRAAGEAMERDVAQLQAELGEVEKGVQTWCEAHRDTLTQGGRVKSHDLGTGTVLWRSRPPRVTIKGGPEAAIAALERLELPQFIRVKKEVNREAMLAAPDLARTVPGVAVGPEGEDFAIEPAVLEGGEA